MTDFFVRDKKGVFLKVTAPAIDQPFTDPVVMHGRPSALKYITPPVAFMPFPVSGIPAMLGLGLDVWITENDDTEDETEQVWPVLSEERAEAITTLALKALADAGPKPVGSRLARFYDVSGDYAGASFAGLEPLSVSDVTATDLHATSLLSVDIGPVATRRLLTPGPVRDQILNALTAIAVDDLGQADASDLLAMERFYLSVKRNLSTADVQQPNPWVTASKLCARKRPGLFPVRDSVVCGYLDLTGRDASYRLDWQAFRHLVRDPGVVAGLQDAAAAALAVAGTRTLRLDVQLLRLLDAALWTYAR